MPRVLIKQSNYNNLQINQPYTVIIRNHGLIIKQITNIDSLESLFITKIEPKQVKKLELQEINKEYLLYFEFLTTEDQSYSFTFISLELPITILFDKLMKVIDPNYEERSLLSENTENPLALENRHDQNSFTQSLDQFIKKAQQSVSQPIFKGLELIQLGMRGLEKTLKNGIQSFTGPITKKESYDDLSTLQLEELPGTEFLLQINKVFLNHIDTALKKDPNVTQTTKNTLLVAEQGIIDQQELQKQTIVFIHPFGLDLSFWKPYLNYYSTKGFRVLAYDMRGWGGSEQHKSDDYEFNDYYKDFLAFLEEKNILLGVNKLTIVTGSLTGLMLLNKADTSLNKKKNISLVLLASADRIDKEMQELIKKLPPARTWGPLKRVGKKKIKEMIVTKELDVDTQDQIVSTLLSADNKVIFETMKNLKSDYVSGLTEKEILNLPFEKILLINGEKDAFIPLKNIETLKKNEKVTIQIIENGNHFIAFEKPELIIKEINEWLN